MNMNIKKMLSSALVVCAVLGSEYVDAKRLEHHNVALLDTGIGQHPLALVRINLARKHAKEVLKKIENKDDSIRRDGEAKFVLMQVQHLLEPISGFFDQIKEYAGVVKPLLDESLGKPVDGAKPSLLQAFFAGGVNTLSSLSFFEKEVKLIKDLEQICNDCVIFFNDLCDSLSEKTKGEYKKLLTEMKSYKDAHAVPTAQASSAK